MTPEPIRDHFGLGCMAAFLLTAFCLGTLVAISIAFRGPGGFGRTVGLPLLSGIGLAQLAWLLPLGIVFWRAGKRQTTYGVISFGALVALLNVACLFLVLRGLGG